MKMYEDPPAEISHRAHGAHKLKLVTTASAPFRCDGCIEPGSGTERRYRCDHCAFDLHTSCALAEPTLKHPLFNGLEFQFLHTSCALPDEPEPTIKHPLLGVGDLELQILHQSPPSVDAKFCSACGHATLGFVYHWSDNKEKDINLHPCCAALKVETVLPDGHMLQLCKEAEDDCVVCGKKGRPPGSSSNKKSCWFGKEKLWAYRWHYGGNAGYLHVACMKKIAAQSWEEAYQDSAGGGVVEASVPAMKSLLQSRPQFRTPGHGGTRSKSSRLPLVVTITVITMVYLFLVVSMI